MGLEFDPLTGVPAEWHIPEHVIVTWLEEATAYAVMKWPCLAAHSRASLAEALATVTPVLTRPGARNRPDQRELRTVLYQRAFSPARLADPGSPAAQVLDWAQRASLPVSCLSESAALDPAIVASPDQVAELLDAVARTRPELTAFFGCLYYAALRPEEAVALSLIDCHLPSSGWGIHAHDDLLNQQIGRVLGPPEGRGPCPSVKKPAVCTDRATPWKDQRLHQPR